MLWPLIALAGFGFLLYVGNPTGMGPVIKNLKKGETWLVGGRITGADDAKVKAITSSIEAAGRSVRDIKTVGNKVEFWFVYVPIADETIKLPMQMQMRSADGDEVTFTIHSAQKEPVRIS